MGITQPQEDLDTRTCGQSDKCFIQFVSKNSECWVGDMVTVFDRTIASFPEVQDFIGGVGKALDLQGALLGVKRIVDQIHRAIGGHQLPGAIGDGP